MTLPRLNAMSKYIQDVRPLHILCETVVAAFSGGESRKGKKASAEGKPFSSPTAKQDPEALLNFASELSGMPGVEFRGLDRLRVIDGGKQQS